MNRPSRGERESATTTRYRGRLLEPSRLSRIETLTCSPPQGWKARQTLELAHAAFHALELLHHLAQLRVLLEQPIDVLHGCSASPCNPLAPRAVDDLGILALARSHRQDDRVEAIEIGLLAVQVLGGGFQRLAERQHAEDLVERPELAHLAELLAEILQAEGILAQLAD